MPIQWEPYQEAPKEEQTSKGAALAQGQETPASYVAKSAVLGTEEQLQKDVGASYAMNDFGGLPEGMLRAFLPKQWVDKLFPYSKILEGTDKQGKPVKATLRQAGEETASYIPTIDRGEAPGDMSRIVGAGAEGFGSMIGNPVGGPMKLGKATLMALGSGMVGEEGGRVGSGLGGAIGDTIDEWFGTKKGGEYGRAAGGVTGSIVGGGVGAQANVLRGKAVGAVGTAISRARALQKEGNEKTLAENIRDEYSSLSAESSGLVQEYVNERVANTLSKNPEVKKNLTEFDVAAKRAGIDPETLEFDLAQKTNDPSLLLAYRTQAPRSLEEAEAEVARGQRQRKAITQALEKTTGQTASAKEVVESLNDIQRSTNAKVVAINVEKERVQDQLPHYTPESKAQAGEGLSNAYEAKKEEARPVRDSWYSAAHAIDQANPTIYDLKPVREKIGAILDETLTRMRPDVAPESLVKLDKMLKRAEGTPAKVERVEKQPGLFETITTPAVKGEQITYKDMEDIFKALNRETPRDATERRNLAIVQDALYKEFSSQSPKELKAAFDKAQSNYKNLYVPMFKEGVNNNLDRRAGLARKGENYYAPDHGLDPYLKKDELVTRMTQFDNLFGGKLIGKRDDRAYQELGKAISDRYYKEMFQADKYTQAKHDQFMRDYEPVFQRVPEAKAQIEQTAAKSLDLRAKMKEEADKFRQAAGSPLNATIGKEKADKLVSSALADGRKMENLIRAMKDHGGTDALLKDVTSRFNLSTDGKFDPKKMDQVLDTGKDGLLKLFESKFGTVAAAQDHYDTLKSISLLAKRQQIMELKGLPPSQRISDDPIRGATGSSGASWMSYYRSLSQGYTSPQYAAVLASGRFINQSLRTSLADAEMKAFNDPATAKAVLELYQKKPEEPISMKSARKITGFAGDMGKKVLDWLIDRGYIKQTMGKGAQLGLTQYTTQKEEEDERSSGR